MMPSTWLASNISMYSRSFRSRATIADDGFIAVFEELVF